MEGGGAADLAGVLVVVLDLRVLEARASVGLQPAEQGCGRPELPRLQQRGPPHGQQRPGRPTGLQRGLGRVRAEPAAGAGAEGEAREGQEGQEGFHRLACGLQPLAHALLPRQFRGEARASG